MKRRQAVRRRGMRLEIAQILRRWSTRLPGHVPGLPRDAASIAAVCLFWLLFLFTIFASAQP